MVQVIIEASTADLELPAWSARPAKFEPQLAAHSKLQFPSRRDS